ncbi:hypothetical protein [Myxococcus sp. AS-1-15]|uniref:hypothetical protein n=1 Tax=Myxococcus sp. AS-1-15 TaxID=2874600 RepID=UPI001CBD0CB8|nr:hypothetical protein [Myxococcus sp. AS-1-15]MBZ4400394.1 hypothetical protein [Myxococcus sp. AS-1-15]
MSRLVLIALVGALLGAAVARTESEWHACAYAGAVAFGLLSLVLLIGGACLAVAAFRRSAS